MQTKSKAMEAFSKLTSRYDMYQVLEEIGGIKNICEVGVDHGWNLTHLCKCKPQLAAAIDLWDVSPYYEFYDLAFHERNYREIMRRVLEENRCILPIRLDSIKAKDIFADGFFQFIYIDASHDYKSAKANIEAYWPKVAAGYFIAGHDYYSGEKIIEAKKLRLSSDQPIVLNIGVKDAVDEFVKKYDLDLVIIKCEATGIDSWVVQKPKN